MSRSMCIFYIAQLDFIGSMHASFTARIRRYVLDTKVYLQYLTIISVNIYLFKVNNRKIRKRSQICLNLTI